MCIRDRGVSDAEVLMAASNVIEGSEGEAPYTPLDLSGITLVQCEGDGGILRYGEFFSGIGLNTYAFYDRQKNGTIVDEITEMFDGSWELQQTGIEYLLAEEISITVVRSFLAAASEWDDYPVNSNNPTRFTYEETLTDHETRGVAKRVLKQRKGSGYAERLVELCSCVDLPEIIVDALYEISDNLPNDMIGAEEEEENAENGDGVAGAPAHSPETDSE